MNLHNRNTKNIDLQIISSRTESIGFNSYCLCTMFLISVKI